MGYLDFAFWDSIKIIVIVSLGPPRSKCQDGLDVQERVTTVKGKGKRVGVGRKSPWWETKVWPLGSRQESKVQ